MDAKNVACFLLVIFTFAVEAKKLPAGDSKVSLDHSAAIFLEEETVNDPNDEACKVNCTTLRNQMMERIAHVIDDLLSKNLQCTASPTPRPTTNASPTPRPTTNGPVDSFTMESRIISGNKSYERTLQEFLKPAVGDVQHWKLCYRHSTDDDLGSKTIAFHAQCDGKPDTVTLVKKGDYVFGGYCDLPWERHSGYKETPNPFIFSLRNKEGLRPFKTKIAPYLTEYAIRDNYEGPGFGGWYDLNLFIGSGTATNSRSQLGDGYKLPEDVKKVVGHYMYPAGSMYFNPDEVEVFYLG